MPDPRRHQQPGKRIGRFNQWRRAELTQSGTDPLPAAPATGKDVRSLRFRAERRLWRTYKPLTYRSHNSLPRQFLFVAGVQRSGTNMVMDLLEWSRWTAVFHETDRLAFDNYEMRPTEVILQLATQTHAPWFVIKSLCELDRIPALMDIFGPARVLWVLREFDDCANSAVRSFENFARQVRRLAVDEHPDDWRGRGMSDATRRVLRTFASDDLSETSAAALMWYYRNILFFERGLDKDPRVTLVRYEELVRTPNEVTREVFAWLGLPDWSPWIVRHVHARSARREVRADIDPGVRTLCDGLRARFDALRG
jgi:Sulfotransferase family